MSLILLIVILIVIGVGLVWFRDHVRARIGDGMYYLITAIVWVVVACLVLSAFGILTYIRGIQVPRVDGG